jgi:hypothetical protein
MSRHAFAFESDLSPMKSASVTLTFGPRIDLILSAGATSCRLSIAVGNLKVETLLVVNPTDLEGFVQGVEDVLR